MKKKEKNDLVSINESEMKCDWDGMSLVGAFLLTPFTSIIIYGTGLNKALYRCWNS